MIFWFVAIAVTAIACAALLYAAGSRTVNAAGPELADGNRDFGLVLAGIDADLAAGKLEAADAEAAKGELAREILRLKAETQQVAALRPEMGRAPLLAGLAGIAALALVVYAQLGSPDLPAQPLADRVPASATQEVDLDQAIVRIEAALAANPDDLRGWTVIAPAYMQMGRFGDAVQAYRRIIALSGPTPDLQTNLAEALMFEAQGAGSPEAMDLLRTAAASDPRHVLSRLYIAAELTRQGDYPAAIAAWNDALALSTGDEPWLPAAQQGLAVAQNDGAEPVDGPAAALDDQQAEMIAGMVSGLASRLAEQGGTIEEWTQLVRAYLVLGDTAKAQAAFDEAVSAYPQAFDRGELDTLALGAGLTIKGAKP
ncbi:c-type cytochrome biogenesis protein CcmI [Devosia sp.]|uniref:c-type cytochrome biogenesis protein CcmI n=1 Tax=Devosia sp. TaxID=1871048 RepID=UPI0027359574|nr:c-type cytochrome biogenesis protein CcmI [Devosia sp.]MDP2780308.1 c-type cytochrome biogenesis protein CcmI [Devosia sp.]